MSEESIWIERAQSAEAKLATLKDAYAPALEKVKAFKANFGIQERDTGEIVIDFEKFVAKLGVESALVLRGVIDEQYHISGKPGTKPRLKVI